MAVADDRLTFLNNISNVLSPPLNDIINAGNDIAAINCHTFKLLDIVNNITDYYMLVNRQIELAPKPVSMRRCIRTVVDMIGIQGDGEDKQITVTIDPAVPMIISIDETRFVQILLNILSNAVRYTPPSGQIDVSVYLDTPDRIYIVVQDTGKGIPEHVLPKLFDPFNNSTTDQSGIGLGMPITREIVRLMNGEIWVDSITEIGTTVHIKIDVSPYKEALSVEELKQHYLGSTVLVTDKTWVTIFSHLGIKTIVSSPRDLQTHISKNTKIDMILLDSTSAAASAASAIVPLFITDTSTPVTTRLGLVYSVSTPDDLHTVLSQLSFIRKDDLIIRILVTYEPIMRHLTGANIETVVSTRYDDIVSKLSNSYFDICFVDTSLPSIDVCTLIKKINKETKFIVITKGKVKMDDYYACGVKGYLIKPCDGIEVKNIVHRLSLTL